LAGGQVQPQVRHGSGGRSIQRATSDVEWIDPRRADRDQVQSLAVQGTAKHSDNFLDGRRFSGQHRIDVLPFFPCC
jgi:hypothetical protein